MLMKTKLLRLSPNKYFIVFTCELLVRVRLVFEKLIESYMYSRASLNVITLVNPYTFCTDDHRWV